MTSETPPQESERPIPPGRRLFLAIALDESVRARLGDLSSRLGKAAQFTPLRANWVPPQNLHVTLHFMGRVEDAQVAPLRAGLDAVAARFRAFPLGFRGLGYFPSERAPRVLWVGVADPFRTLSPLVTSLGEMLSALGLEPERDNFHAHVTLARFHGLKGTGAFVKLASEHANVSFGRQVAHHVALFESHTTSSPPRYELLHEAALAPRSEGAPE